MRQCWKVSRKVELYSPLCLFLNRSSWACTHTCVRFIWQLHACPPKRNERSAHTRKVVHHRSKRTRSKSFLRHHFKWHGIQSWTWSAIVSCGHGVPWSHAWSWRHLQDHLQNPARATSGVFTRSWKCCVWKVFGR